MGAHRHASMHISIGTLVHIDMYILLPMTVPWNKVCIHVHMCRCMCDMYVQTPCVLTTYGCPLPPALDKLF